MSRSLLVSLLMVGWFVFCGCESYNSDFKIMKKGQYNVLEKYDGHDEHVVIPEGVTEIGDRAFEQCTSLKSIEIPRSVLAIGDNAFCSCDSLISVEIPDSVMDIGNMAFAFCPELRSVTIPSSVTVFGRAVFANSGFPPMVRIPEGATEEEARYLQEHVQTRLVIHAPRGSAAEEYARENNLPFMPE